MAAVVDRTRATGRDVVEALRRAGLTSVDTAPRRRAEYSTDASLYRVLPSVVAFPRHADELAAAVAVARETGTPLTVRGGGTSIAGNAVGEGIVLDVSRHLNRILNVDPEAAEAVVEPGVILTGLQKAAGPHGLRFGPDPSTANRATLGGMIGNNACGSRALGYGRTDDNVVALDVITGAGERVHLRRGSDDPVTRRAAAVVARDLATVRTEFGTFGRQVSGYALEHLLPERGVDAARLLVGSEGTLALTARATLRLVRAPARTVLVVLSYPDMVAAADAVPALLAHRPIAVEGLDGRIVDAVRTRTTRPVPELPRGAGWLFVELGSSTGNDLPDRAAAVVRDAGAIAHRLVTEPREAKALWAIREDGAGLSTRAPSGKPGHAGWEDAAVPPERFGAYLRGFEALLAEFGLTGIPYGHFGDGCLHVRIDLPLTEPGGRGVFRRFLEQAADLAVAHGGSMSGEHGDGRARGELLARMFSPRALELFAQVKHAFDPDDVLNPGVLVRPRAVDDDLRPRPWPTTLPLTFRYSDDGGSLATAVHRCVGVGKCRADLTGVGGVMCPSYLATRDEKDSTRARARVLQEMVAGTAGAPTTVDRGWRSPEVLEVLDLCLSCKGCLSDCPTGVDMATYKAEALHQAYRGRLRPRSHYALGWLPWLSRLAALAPRAANALLASPAAPALKAAAGVDRRRGLPRFAARRATAALARRRRRVPTATTRPVLLWVDSFTEHFSPSVAEAAVRVLEHAGFAVRVAPRDECCGLTLISTGQLGLARRALAATTRTLLQAAGPDDPVVVLEPSCLAVLRHDARELLGAADAEALAARAVTLAELITECAPDVEWPGLDGLPVVAQPHCHHHAVMGYGADEALLRRAGADVQVLGGCCGLAGNFGVERGHHDVSVAVAGTTLLPAVAAAPDGAVVLADGFSCRTQLAELADRPGTHLAELLARALPAG